MKKRIIALVLSIVMVLGAVSLSASASPSVSYASEVSDSASYLMKLPEGSSLDSTYQYNSNDKAVPIVEENGEKFLLYNEDNFSKFANQDTFSADIFMNKITYSYDANSNGYGIPTEVPFSINAETNTEDASTMWLAIRMKIDDFGAAFKKTGSSMRVLMRLYDEANSSATEDKFYTKELFTQASNAAKWLDAKDGSMTWFYADSGVYKTSSNKGAGNLEFTGDMDGYLMIPIKTFVSTEELRKYFAGFEFILAEGTTAGGVESKESQWDDKALLIGDSFIVSDDVDFQSDVIAANNIEKYALNGGEDTAYQAIRIGGYRTRYYATGSGSKKSDFFNKNQYNPDVADIANSRYGLLHVTTLPNGDRALEISINTQTGTNDLMTYQSSSATEYYVGLPTWDTYDHLRDGLGNTSSGTSGFRTKQHGKGVPEADIDLDDMNYIAFRIAVKGTGTNAVPANTNAGTHLVNISVGVGGTSSASPKYFKLGSDPNFNTYKFIDINTGRVIDMACNSTGLKMVGDVDGYLMVPIDKLNSVTKATLQAEFGNHLYQEQSGTRIRLRKDSEHSSWDDGAKFYFGGAVWVEDATKFQKYHCPHVNTTAGTTVNPTCQDEGYTPCTCDDCGFAFNKDKRDPVSCDYSVDVPGQESTCTEPGFESAKKCKWCGEIDPNSLVGETPLKGHTPTPCEEVPSTCKVKGSKAGVRCSVCSLALEGCEELDLAEHNMDIGVEEIQATCKAPGVSEGKKCSMCLEVQMGCEPIPQKTECNNYTVVDPIPATCQQGGVSEGRKCSWCDTLQSGCEPTEKIPCDKKVDVREVPASCEAGGTAAGKKCSMCGKITEGCSEIAMREHKFVKIGYTAPTEEEKGHDNYQCTECDYIEPRNWVDRLKPEGEAEEDNIGDDIGDNSDNDAENNIDDGEGNSAGQSGSEQSPITGENAIFLVVMIVLCLGAAAVLFFTRKRTSK